MMTLTSLVSLTADHTTLHSGTHSTNKENPAHENLQLSLLSHEYEMNHNAEPHSYANPYEEKVLSGLSKVYHSLAQITFISEEV